MFKVVFKHFRAFQGIRTTPEKRRDVVCCVCVSDLLEMQLGCDIKNIVSQNTNTISSTLWLFGAKTSHG